MEILQFNQNTDPIEIIENIRQQAFDPDCFGSLDDYLVWLSQSLWKFNQIGIQIPNDTIENKCQAVVEQLVQYGFLELI